MKKIYSLCTALLLSVCPILAQTGLTCNNAIPETANSTCNYTTHQANGTEFWAYFTATMKNVNISLITTQFGDDVPHIHSIALISGSCTNQTVLAEDELPFVNNADRLAIDLNASDLIIGNTYYLRVKRDATVATCDKAGCTGGNPAIFDLCVENIDVIIPLDFGLEPPSISHAYEQNRGQLVDVNGNPRPDIKLYTKSNPAVYIRDNAVSYVFAKIDTIAATPDSLHRVDMTLTGGNMGTRIFKTEQVQGTSNYYLGHIPKGVTGNKAYSRTVQNNVYPNIDMQYYSNRDGVKFYFIAKPGSNPDNIIMKFEGADAVIVTPGGGLNIQTSLGNITFEAPHVYRINPGGQVVPMPWQAMFESVSANEVKFKLHPFAQNMPLYIQVDRGHTSASSVTESGLCWSTHLGGSNYEEALGITLDTLGNQYVTGFNLDGGFPVQGGFNNTYFGYQQCFLTKFKPNHEILFSTYFGGSEDQSAFDIKCKNSNEVYICGWTRSQDFPGYAVPGAYNDAVHKGNQGDGYIAKFDTLGMRTWATLFGGFGSDRANSIDFDSNGNFYITGQGETSNFPLLTLTGAYNEINKGGRDSYIAKFNGQDTLIWCSFIGGNGFDAGSCIRVDNQNNVAISGVTLSTDFSTQNPGGLAFHESTLKGSRDLFVSKFSSSGAYIWGTLIGGSGNEFNNYYFDLGPAKNLAFDNNNHIYLVGTTTSTDFPVSMPVGGGHYDDTYSDRDGFIIQFSSSNHSRLWSTYISGEGKNFLTAVAVNMDNRLFIAGATDDSLFLLQTQTTGYNQSTLRGDVVPSGFKDGALLVFENDHTLLYGTYIGGHQTDYRNEFISSIAVFNNDFYFTGLTQTNGASIKYPTYDPGNNAYYEPLFKGGSIDAFVTQICIEDFISYTGIEEQVNINSLKLLPNPTTGEINLLFTLTSSDKVEIRILNFTGQLVQKISLEANAGINSIKFNMAPFSSGIYLLNLKSDNVNESIKVIKQ